MSSSKAHKLKLDLPRPMLRVFKTPLGTSLPSYFITWSLCQSSLCRAFFALSLRSLCGAASERAVLYFDPADRKLVYSLNVSTGSTEIVSFLPSPDRRHILRLRRDEVPIDVLWKPQPVYYLANPHLSQALGCRRIDPICSFPLPLLPTLSGIIEHSLGGGNDDADHTHFFIRPEGHHT